MGVLTTLAVTGGVATLLGGGLSAYEQEKAADLRLKQEELAETNRSAQRTHRLNEILAQQNADEGVSGFSTSSPSFFSISDDTFNQYSQDETADKLNLDFDKLNHAQAVKNAWIGFGTDIAQEAANFGEFSKNASFSTGQNKVGKGEII